MKCILIDSEQRDQELGKQRVEDLFQIEDRLFTILVNYDCRVSKIKYTSCLIDSLQCKLLKY